MSPPRHVRATLLAAASPLFLLALALAGWIGAVLIAEIIAP